MKQILRNIPPTLLARNALKYFGMLVQDGKPWSTVLPAYHLSMALLMGITSVIQISKNENLTETVQTISMISIFIHNFAKGINIFIHQAEILELLQRLDSFRLEIWRNKDYQSILISSEVWAKKTILALSVLFVSIPFMSIINNFAADYISSSVKPHLVVNVWVPWSMKQFWPYVFGMIFVMLQMLTMGIFYAVSNAVQLTFTFEVCTFLKVLQERLRIRQGRDKLIYRDHLEILRLIQDYKQLFSSILYLEILISSLQPLGFVYAAMKAIKSYDSEAFDLIFKLIACLTSPIIICASGQEINSQLEALHRFSYMSKWYEEQPAIRKDLLTMMIATVKPNGMNYRGMVSFNYVCYAKVIQGVYSYLMMIIQLEPS